MRPRLVLSAFAISASIMFSAIDMSADAGALGERQPSDESRTPLDDCEEAAASDAVGMGGDSESSGELLLSRGTDEELMAVARGILQMQASEVDFIEDWLARSDAG